jgi:hypothetical protein
MTACDWMPGEIQSYVIPESDPAFTATLGLHLTSASVIAKGGQRASMAHLHVKITGREDLICFQPLRWDTIGQHRKQ